MPTLSIRNIAGFAHVLSNPRCNEEAGPVGTRQQFAHIRRPSAPKITAFRQYPGTTKPFTMRKAGGLQFQRTI
jgi:hypothetical protein